MHVLDVGCDIGHFIEWLTQRVAAAYHGIDLSTESVRRAHTTNPGAAFVVGDAERLPFRDAMFDRIACNGAAHHLPDLRAAFAELHRVLAPGGKVVLFEPVSSRFTNAVRRVFGYAAAESPADHEHKHDVRIGDVQDVLRAVGFHAPDASFSDSLAYPLSGMYADPPLAHSRAAMTAVLRLETWLQARRPSRRLLELIAWRMLAVATKR